MLWTSDEDRTTTAGGGSTLYSHTIQTTRRISLTTGWCTQKVIHKLDAQASRCSRLREREREKKGRADICARLGYYAAASGSSVPTFRDNLSVPSSRAKVTESFFQGTSWLLYCSRNQLAATSECHSGFKWQGCRHFKITGPEVSFDNIYSVSRSLDSWMSMVTFGYGLGGGSSNSISRRGRDCFCPRLRPYRLWDPPRSLSRRNQGLFSRG
jgi:hypothetical protein